MIDLIGNLTRFAFAGGIAALAVGCANNAPRRPAPTPKVATFDQRCIEAYERGGFAPAGCQDYYETRRVRRAPTVVNEPMTLPSLPSGSLPTAPGGLLGR